MAPPGGTGLRPQVGRWEPTWGRGAQAGPRAGAQRGMGRFLWRRPSPVESRFYWVYKQPFKKTKPLCVHTGRTLRDKLVQTAVLQMGTRPTGESRVPRDSGNSDLEPELEPPPGSVHGSFKDQLPSGHKFKCPEELQTTPQTLVIPFLPPRKYSLQTLEKQGRGAKPQSGIWGVGEEGALACPSAPMLRSTPLHTLHSRLGCCWCFQNHWGAGPAWLSS